jgi:vitamin K-dependent gamma-carboxylase
LVNVSEDIPVIGWLFSYLITIQVAAYGSILLHIVGAPLLWCRQTRMIVFLAYCCFHFINHILFNIGIFPWLTIAATLLFFSPSWPRQLLGLKYQLPLVQVNKSLFNLYAMCGLVLFLSFQILLPLRHYLFDHDVAWTEEGHKFSWRMKLRSKDSESLFFLKNIVENTCWAIDSESIIEPSRAGEVSARPDMI